MALNSEVFLVLAVQGRFPQETVDLTQHTLAERSIYEFVLVSDAVPKHRTIRYKDPTTIASKDHIHLAPVEAIVFIF